MNNSKEVRASKQLTWGSAWTFELIELYEREIDRVAREVFHLDVYPIQLEMISSEQMLDRYTAVGMPLMYPHWSFGKSFAMQQKAYASGHMGLAYEIVINSKPCIAYLMEDNTLTMQALVIAHAAYGHNSFFKGNYLFRKWTEADAIVDYLDFARDYVRMCEEKHGVDAVENVMDAAHALQRHGVDRYERPHKASLSDDKKRQEERIAYAEAHYNDLWRTLPRNAKKKKEEIEKAQERFPSEPQENILYFLEKHAPFLKTWERELIRIVRRIAQYFYPQMQTQVMNEGWATFWHYTILNQMYDEGLLHDGFMEEFLASHTAVVFQPAFNDRRYNGINPYALGFNMFRDIRRICEGGVWKGSTLVPENFHPSDEEQLAEDRKWFPKLAGSNWRASLEDIMKNYRDESFILQFLSPKLIREMRLFALYDKDGNEHLWVTSTHNERGYREVREKLAAQYDITLKLPDIQVVDVDLRGDRTLMLEYFPFKGRELEEKLADQTLQHLANLWRAPVEMQMQSPSEPGKVGIGAAFPPKEWYTGT